MYHLPQTMVFEDGQGGVCVLSPCRGGLFINHIYSPRPGFIFRYRDWLVGLAQSMGYSRLHCRPNDSRLWGLYVGRWGFMESDGSLVLELSNG